MTIAKAPARRTLAQEIEKLDGILEGLGETLRGVVAESVPQAVEATLVAAVGPAVQQAVQQVLTHPDHQARLGDTLTPKAIRLLPMPAPATGSEGTLTSAWKRCCQVLLQAANVASEVAQVCKRIARRHPGVALATLGTAVVAMMAAWWFGPWLGALAGWVGGLLTAQVGRFSGAPPQHAGTNSTSAADSSPDPAA